VSNRVSGDEVYEARITTGLDGTATVPVRKFSVVEITVLGIRERIIVGSREEQVVIAIPWGLNLRTLKLLLHIVMKKLLARTAKPRQQATGKT